MSLNSQNVLSVERLSLDQRIFFISLKLDTKSNAENFFFYFGQMIYLKLQFFITFSLDTNRSNKKWTNAPVVNLRHSIVFMKFPLNGIANRMRVSHIIHNLFFSLSLSIHLFRLLWQQHFHWIFFFLKEKRKPQSKFDL